MHDKLKEGIEKLEEEFSKKATKYFKNSMCSKPGFSLFYQELMDTYGKGADVCAEYLEKFELLKFVRELKDLGFEFEVLALKQFISDPEVVKEIISIEESIKECFSEASN